MLCLWNGKALLREASALALPLCGGLSLMTSPLQAWLGFSTLSTPANVLLTSLGNHDLSKGASSWCRERGPLPELSDGSRLVGHIVPSLFLISHGRESLLLTKSAPMSVTLFPLIDLSWPGEGF